MTRAIERHQTLIVAAVVFATCLPYVGSLGFYNDDWALLAAYQNVPRKDLWSLMLADGELMRPARVAYSAALYWLFRHSALGYHLTNSLVLAASCALFSALLRRSGVPPRDAAALSIVWGTLPHAATGRFWYVIFQMPASIALLLAAALSELQSLDRRKWLWRVVAVLCLAVSALLYEIALPLCLLIPLLALRYARLRGQILDRRDKLWLWVYPTAFALLVPMKILTTTRLDAGTPAAFAPWFVSNLRSVFAVQQESTVWGFNIWRALHIAFVELGLRLPGYAVESAKSLGPGLEVAMVLALAVATFLWLVAPTSMPTGVGARAGLIYVAAGAAFFFLGWTVFLGSSSLQLSATGIGNRTAGAASIGVAFIFVGVMKSVASLAPRRQRHVVFAMLSSLTVACSTLVIYRTAADWRRAWTTQQEVLSQVSTLFPGGFSGRALLLDGVCQYVGPATVFEASWDLQWALQTRYSDPTIRADVVTQDLEIGQSGLRTALYGEEKLYPYGSVMVYRPASNVARVLREPEDAERFFALLDPDRSGGCAPGRIGTGVAIFRRGGDVAYEGGFYDAERDRNGVAWRWMTTLGVVSLRNSHHDMTLTIKGRVPEQVTKAPRVMVTFNGHVLDAIDGTREVDRAYYVPRSMQGDGDLSELRISTDQTVIPRQVNPASADRRRLGFVLYDLTWKPR